MNLTQASIELRGAARIVPTALSLALIGGACTSALAFRQQVAVPQAQTTTTQPAAVVIGVPRTATGQPEQSFKVDIADASGPNPVIKVLTPPFVDAAQPNPDPACTSPVTSLPAIASPCRPGLSPRCQAAKLSGTVVLHAVIGKDGTIRELTVLSGPNQFANPPSLPSSNGPTGPISSTETRSK